MSGKPDESPAGSQSDGVNLTDPEIKELESILTNYITKVRDFRRLPTVGAMEQHSSHASSAS